ncbi:MAG: hypothetical protein CMG35_08410 [Candidatus Marinimicrobia bacterium]|nr:hypothetical protein [Candidatus Neomarinimicrobiota bacterium]
MVNFTKIVFKEPGVKCSFCHILNDYSSDKRANKVVARQMININHNAIIILRNLYFTQVFYWFFHNRNRISERNLSINKLTP